MQRSYIFYHMLAFALQEVKAMDRGSIWLKYTIKNNKVGK